MTEGLHLIARIAGQRVAMSTATIDSVVEVDGVTPVPRAAAHVAGLTALRSRVLTLIDCDAALGLPVRHEAPRRVAIVLVSDGHLYGLLVDAVEDVVALSGAPRPLRTDLTTGWARAALGMVEHEGEALLAIDPASLVAPPFANAA